LEFSGLRVNLKKGRGFFVKLTGIIGFGYFFQWQNWWIESIAHGLSGNRWSTSSLWTPQWMVARASTELGLAAAPGHGGLPRLHRKDEEITGVRFRDSPKMERRRDDRAMPVKRWGW
jgi:hypothetical protein